MCIFDNLIDVYYYNGIAKHLAFRRPFGSKISYV